MAETTTQTTISREAPYLEDYRRRLLESTFQRADQPRVTPAQQIAPLETEVAQARQLAQTGLGAYQPYLTTAGTELAGAQTGLAGAAAPLTTAQTGITGAAAPTLAAATPYVTGAAAPISTAQAGITGVAAPYITGAQAPITTAQTLAEQAAVAPTQAGLAQYMNPYTADVTQSALAEMTRQADIQRNRLGAEAVGAGAYGGARMGVQGAELDRNLADIQSQRIFQDLQTNYNQALGAFQRQQQAGLGAAAGLGQLGQAEAGLGQQLGGLYGQLGHLGQAQAGLGTTLGQLGGMQADVYGRLGQMSGEQARQAGLRGQIGAQQAQLAPMTQQLGQQDIQSVLGIGDIYRTQAQRELEATRQTELEQYGEPFQRLSWTSDILSRVPSLQQTTAVTSAPSPSPIQSALGLGIAGAAAMKGATTSPYGMLGMGGGYIK